MKHVPELQVMVEKLNVHKCDKCPKVFPKPSDLMKHMAYHDEWLLSHATSAHVVLERAKIFKCDQCTQSFCTKREFMLHKIAHIQKNVRDERKISRLQTTDDIVKPYKCPDCDYKFVAQSSLEEHSILHQPYPNICQCGIGYYKLQDLKCHMKLVHGSELKPTLTPNTDSEKNNEVIPERKPNPSKARGPTLKANLVEKKKPTKKRWKVKMIDKENNNERKPKNFWNIPKLNIEINITPDKKFECPECKKLFNCKSNFVMHYRVHSGERPYSCKICGKAFNQSGALIKHIRAHNPVEKTCVCRHCDKAFRFPENRDRHELIHSTKKYECPGCGKAFHDPSALIRHKRIHTGDKRYRCPYCPKAFSDVSGLRGHKLRHEKIKNFSCDICLKKFYSQSDLKNHMVSHSLERKFGCHYCNKCFSTKWNLALHIERHSAIKQFKCEQCSMKFTTKEYRRSHVLRVHEKINSERNVHIECDICSTIFARKSAFLNHFLSVHSGIRCRKCSRYFSCKTYFKEHKLKEMEQCVICDKKFFCKNVKEHHILKIHAVVKK